jgi:hypothetical protein
MKFKGTACISSVNYTAEEIVNGQWSIANGHWLMVNERQQAEIVRTDDLGQLCLIDH